MSETTYKKTHLGSLSREHMLKGEEGYRDWRTLVEKCLRQDGMSAALEPRPSVPPSTQEAIDKWDNMSDTVTLSVMSLLHKDLVSGRAGYNSYELFADLAETFEGSGAMVGVAAATEVYNFEFDENDIVGSLKEFDIKVARLRKLDATALVSTTQLANLVLSKLKHSRFASFKSAFIQTNQTFTYQTLKSALIADDRLHTPAVDQGALLRAEMATSKCHACDQLGHFFLTCPLFQAFKSQRGGGGGSTTVVAAAAPAGGRVCAHCTTLGRPAAHAQIDCHQLYPEKRPANYGQSKKVRTHAARAALQDPPVVFTSATSLSVDPTNPNLRQMRLGYVGQANRVSGPRENVWLGDSGATVHSTHDRGDFIPGTFEPTPSGAGVTIANGDLMPIEGKGTVALRVTVNGKKATILLKGVLHVPSLDVKLLSLTKLLEVGYSCKSEKDGSLFFYAPDGLLSLECKLKDSTLRVVGDSGRGIWESLSLSTSG